MRRIQPSSTFCEAVQTPHPMPEHKWHPEQFTLKGLADMVQALWAYDVLTTSPKVVRGFLGSQDTWNNFFDPIAPDSAPQPSKRIAALFVPVAFSPSHALRMADVFDELDTKTTFLFDANSPTYSFDSGITQVDIASLANRGHAIGLQGVNKETDLDAAIAQLQDISGQAVDTVGVRSLGLKPDQVRSDAEMLAEALNERGLINTHDPIFTRPNLAMCTTSNGVYKEAHPEADFLNDYSKSFAMIQLIECWFSKEEKLPLQRLMDLPEIKANATRFEDAYLAKTKSPILGSANTVESVPGQTSQPAKRPGWRAFKHEF